MVAREASEPNPKKNVTTAEQKSDRELVVTRTFDAPAQAVFTAWTTPELMRKWWVPKSFGLTLRSIEMDVRVGGGYRLVFLLPNTDGKEMAFFGTYREVVPYSRLVWTNDEGGESGAVTTVTLEEKDGKTHLVMSDLYPSKAALDEAIASGSAAGGFEETFAQLDELLRS